MATNIEIKARIKDFDRHTALAESISDTPCQVIRQEDTFFHTPRGRLKLRVLAPDRGQLIYYDRQDASGPKRSDYLLSPIHDPDSLKAILAASLGIRGVVRKKRLLYLVGNTRIHLDQVEGLGAFLELEVMIGPEDTEEEGQKTADELMTRLQIEGVDLINVAYIDLLEGRTA
jgi:predicted adenylyl cyclase CyaB